MRIRRWLERQDIQKQRSAYFHQPHAPAIRSAHHLSLRVAAPRQLTIHIPDTIPQRCNRKCLSTWRQRPPGDQPSITARGEHISVKQHE